MAEKNQGCIAKYRIGTATMKHWIPAPSTDTQPHSGAVLGVSLNAGERVQWAYTILPDGRRVVTGYDIITPLLPRPTKKKRRRTEKK
jgi:hypothetical protein